MLGFTFHQGINVMDSYITSKYPYVWLSAALYLISLFLPAAVVPNVGSNAPEIMRGGEILCLGWMGVISLQPAWLANPAYILALLLDGSETGYYLSWVSVILAFFSPFFIVEKVLIGFYIWILSFVVLLLGNYLYGPDTI